MIGLDLGLRSTGVAWDTGSDLYVCPDDIDGGSRLDWWFRTFKAVLFPHVGGHAGVESPFFHPQHPGGATQLIHLHGVLQLAAHHADITIHYVAPASLKKHATGNGRATKDDMVAHARWLRPGIDLASHDEADAICVWHWLAEHLEGKAA